MPSKTAAILLIGDELLCGRTQDANLQFLAKRLTEIGIVIAQARVVPDEIETIVDALNALRFHHTYVFTTGGIGPTHDDRTAYAVCRAFDRPLRRDPEAERRLERHYGPENLTPARLKMADIPQDALLIDNPISVAPGFQIENVYVLAGVPMIMRAMMEGILPRLEGGEPIWEGGITCSLREGVLAHGLETLQNRYPDVKIGSYPYFREGHFGVSVTARSTQKHRILSLISNLQQLIHSLGDPNPLITLPKDAPPS